MKASLATRHRWHGEAVGMPAAVGGGNAWAYFQTKREAVAWIARMGGGVLIDRKTHRQWRVSTKGEVASVLPNRQT
jgi:hypothetical protein